MSLKESLLKKNSPEKEERRLTAREYVGEGSKVSMVLTMVGISRSTYYYKPSHGKRGRKAERVVRDHSGREFTEGYLVEEVRELLSRDFVNY
ncbi:MAG TPA: hypothetical protein VJ024_08980 [Thermodesulfovibrionales bacterium]|nr:hypothetical protein [Thermodesulfovibrionales bacterium]